jgi:hypothetical protein
MLHILSGQYDVSRSLCSGYVSVQVVPASSLFRAAGVCRETTESTTAAPTFVAIPLTTVGADQEQQQAGESSSVQTTTVVVTAALLVLLLLVLALAVWHRSLANSKKLKVGADAKVVEVLGPDGTAQLVTVDTTMHGSSGTLTDQRAGHHFDFEPTSNMNRPQLTGTMQCVNHTPILWHRSPSCNMRCI